jgi:pimeloyl-ACP methyl ester carboxylesterase
MSLVFKDALFDAQWLRAAGHSAYGGAEINECFVAARSIREPDGESWYRSWNELAMRVRAEGDASLAHDNRVSALGSYLRASNYFRTAYCFLMGAPVDPRLVEAYRNNRAAFAAAIELMRPKGERVAIPFEGKTLHGYVFRPANDAIPRPTLIINGGYDSTAEESYFFSGAAATARGYTVIVFDGPGQGAALIEDGLVFRPDWEKIITPVVDFALTRPETDAKRIALLGISFGGYLAPRAASAEPRIAALIADPGEYSLFEEFKSRMPGFIARGLASGNPLARLVLRVVLARRLRHPTGGWGLRRGLWTHGVNSAFAYIRLTADYNSIGRAQSIRCPTLVCSAENDDIGVTAPALYEALTCTKAFKAFKASEGAGEHCEAGARSVFNQHAFDWLDAVFGSRASMAIPPITAKE